MQREQFGPFVLTLLTIADAVKRQAEPAIRKGVAMKFWRGVDDSTLSKAARNERRKIRANFMNGLAIAAVAIGYLTPMAAIFLRQETPTKSQFAFLVALVLVSFFSANEFHSTALRQVDKIED